MHYWRVTKPLSLGTRVMVIYKDEVLLVRHTYVKGYFLPGGGMHKSELFKDCAIRELKEEVDLSVENLSLFGVFQSTQEQKYTTNVVYLCLLTKKPDLTIQRSELHEAGFFKLDDLPKETSPGTKRRIKEYLEKRYPLTGEW